MEFITFEESKDRVLGKVGTPRRDVFEENAKKELREYHQRNATQAHGQDIPIMTTREA